MKKNQTHSVLAHIVIAISAPMPVLKPQRSNNTMSAYHNQPREDWRVGQPRKRVSHARQRDNNDGGDKATMMDNGKKYTTMAKKDKTIKQCMGEGG
jgi:hypothetical protein